MKTPNRRTFLKTSAIAGAAGFAVSAHGKSIPTPKQTEGPFYPITPQKDKDFDLTMIEGNEAAAEGDAIMVTGKVVDTEGNVIEDATVDLWQANTHGRYHHPHDKSENKVDPNFQGWAIVQSGKEGEFKFKTIKPGAYAVSRRWSRPPHIHFKVSKRGYVEVTTQMYFSDEEAANKIDRILQRHSKEEQDMLIAKKTDGDVPSYDFTVVLAKA